MAGAGGCSKPTLPRGLQSSQTTQVVCWKQPQWGRQSPGPWTRVPHLPLVGAEAGGGGGGGQAELRVCWGVWHRRELGQQVSHLTLVAGFRENWREHEEEGVGLGDRVVSWGRREQVVTCFSAQLFCVQEPERERDRSSWEEKKQGSQGPYWSFCLSHRS